jgi:NACHT domain
VRLPGEPRERAATAIVVIGAALTLVFYQRFHSTVMDLATVAGTLVAVWVAIAAAPTVDLDQASQDLAHEVTKSWAKKRLILLGDTEPARLTYLRDSSLERGPRVKAVPPRGSLASLVKQFRSQGMARLVILGPAGSGKTLAAVELALAFLEERALQKESLPVAIPLSISGWDGGTGLHDWLVNRLVTDYRVPTRMARSLVGTGRILPVLDGLDEMGQESDEWKPDPSAALRELSQSPAMLAGARRRAVILTSRDDFYDDIVLRDSGGSAGLPEVAVGLLEAAVVRLNPISPSDAASFLRSRFRDRPGASPLSDPEFAAQLRNTGSPLSQALSRPLDLALAVPVLGSGELRPDALTSLGSPDEISARLLDSFIPAVTKTIPRNISARTQVEKLRKGLYEIGVAEARHYKSDDVRRWLVNLAVFLRDRPNPGNEISPMNLWKIGGTTVPRAVHTAMSLTMGIVVALFAAEFAAGAGGLVVTILGIVVGIRFGLVAGLRLNQKPSRFSAGQLFTRKGRRLWVIAIATGAAGAIGGYLDGGPATAVSSGVGAALAGVVLAGMNRGISRDVLPWEIIRNDFLFGLILGLAPAVADAFPRGIDGGLTTRLDLNSRLGLPGSILLAIAVSVIAGIALGSRSWLRHAITIVLVAPSGRLPWRTQHFLEWAYLANLLRVSGISYQFRHDELRLSLTSARNAAGESRPRAGP